MILGIITFTEKNILQQFYVMLRNAPCPRFSNHEQNQCMIQCTFIQKFVDMMTSSNGNIFRVTGPLCGNSPVPVNSPHKGQWRGALMFSLICVWINGWVNNRESGDLRRHLGHYDVIVMTVECQYNIDTAEVLKTFTLYIFLENISAAILIVIWSWDMFYLKIDPSCLAFRGHIHTTSTILREIIVSPDKESISIW